jgi:hypothetical protein
MRAFFVLMPIVLVGCASNMTDEAALTLARTRDSTVRTSEKLAETSERLPRTIDEANEGLSRITSTTSAAIAAFAQLSTSLDRTTNSLGRLLDEARSDTLANREQWRLVLADVTAITSATQSILARVEAGSRTWSDRAEELSGQEARAAKALAQMSEATARVSESIARLSTTVEPDLASASRSVATILADTAKLTHQLANQERAAESFSVGAGAVAGLVVVLLVLLGRALFLRAVESAAAGRSHRSP